MSSSSVFDFISAPSCTVVGVSSVSYIARCALFGCLVCAMLYARFFSAPMIGRAIAATLELLLNDDPCIRRGRRKTTPNLLIMPLDADRTPVLRVLRKDHNTETVQFVSPVRTSAVVFALSDESVGLLREVSLSGKVFVVCCDASMMPGTAPSFHHVLCVRQCDRLEVSQVFGCAVTTEIGHRVTDKAGKSVLRGIHTAPSADPAEFGTQALPWQGVGSLLGREKTFKGEAVAPKLISAVVATDSTHLTRPFHYCQIFVVSDDFEYDDTTA